MKGLGLFSLSDCISFGMKLTDEQKEAPNVAGIYLIPMRLPSPEEKYCFNNIRDPWVRNAGGELIQIVIPAILESNPLIDDDEIIFGDPTTWPSVKGYWKTGSPYIDDCYTPMYYRVWDVWPIDQFDADRLCDAVADAIQNSHYPSINRYIDLTNEGNQVEHLLIPKEQELYWHAWSIHNALARDAKQRIADQHGGYVQVFEDELLPALTPEERDQWEVCREAMRTLTGKMTRRLEVWEAEIIHPLTGFKDPGVQIELDPDLSSLFEHLCRMSQFNWAQAKLAYPADEVTSFLGEEDTYPWL